MKSENKIFSGLESAIMDIVWSNNPCSAEQVREKLSENKVLKDSTVRTILRRLEEKGYLKHYTEGRTYYYKPTVSQHRAAVRALKNIINRFCGGSVENLLVGMVNDEMLLPEELEEMAQKIAESAKSGQLKKL